MHPHAQASDHEKHLFSSPLSSEGVGMNHSGRRRELKELGRSTRFPSFLSTSLHPTLPRHTFIVLVVLSILFYASASFSFFLCSCVSARPEQRLDFRKMSKDQLRSNQGGSAGDHQGGQEVETLPTSFPSLVTFFLTIVRREKGIESL